MATSSDHTKARLALEKLGDVSRKSECSGSVESRAFTMGRVDFKRGYRLCANPFCNSENDFNEWAYGWWAEKNGK